MCNDYEQHIAWAEYQAMMDSLALPTAPHQSPADLPRADDIKINDIGPVIRKSDDALHLSPMRLPEDWKAWVDLDRPEEQLLRPSPANSLVVKTVRPGSD